jgi:hypothetical protein
VAGALSIGLLSNTVVLEILLELALNVIVGILEIVFGAWWGGRI